MLLIAEDGAQLGIKTLDESIALAFEIGLDVVEVGNDKNTPVCKFINYGKYRFEQHKKDSDAKKRQKVVLLKEIKLRPKIGTHDYETKVGHVRRFLSHGDKVKITVMFRGREVAYIDFGRKLLERVLVDLKEVAVLEQRSKLEDNNLAMLLAPRIVKEEKSAKDKNKEVSGKEV